MQRFFTTLGVIISLAGGIAGSPAEAIHLNSRLSVVAVVSQAESDRAFVRRIADRDPRSTVRATAWAALISPTIDAAVARFFASDYDFAKRWSLRTTAANLDFARRVLATHTLEYSPLVHEAALRAVNGSDADRASFARSGYADAKANDRRRRDVERVEEAALVAADREFVSRLGARDPGPQVRGAVAWALRAGSTNSDIVEFFAYGWANAAALDLQAFTIAATDAEAQARAAASRLVADAEAAEQAALGAGAGPGTVERENAVRAWRAVADHSTSAANQWTTATDVAAQQVSNWAVVRAAAQAAAGPNWSAVSIFATVTESEWISARQWAAEQVTLWNELTDRALIAEYRVR